MALLDGEGFARIADRLAQRAMSQTLLHETTASHHWLLSSSGACTIMWLRPGELMAIKVHAREVKICG